MKRVLIVGSGFAGSTFARLAAEKGIEVHVIDQKDHIGGNCYSYSDVETGIEIHKYGPHIFHTNYEEVYEFISRFTKFNNYVNRVKAVSNNKVYSLPINLHTINQFFGKNLSPKEAEEFIDGKRVKFDEISNFKEFVLNSLGYELYKAFFRDYTIKQWGKPPEEIPLSTAKRLPIRYNYNDNYFNDKYQGIPTNGYGSVFERILDHKNITITLNTSFTDVKNKWKNEYDYLIFTGSIDLYFDYCHGYLPYRTVWFEEIRDCEIQGNAVINYSDMSVPYTRIHEHKYFTPEKEFKKSVAFKEFSKKTDSQNNPYYAIENYESKLLIEKYNKLAG